MQILFSVGQVLFLMVIPRVIYWLCQHTRLFAMLGTVLTAYGIGIALRSFHLVPGDLTTFEHVSEAVMLLSIMTAIALLLYTTDFLAWLRHAKTSVTAFVIMCMCILLASGTLTTLLGSNLQESWKVGGMMVGSFTGGLPNFASIGMALKVNQELFAVVSAIEVSVSFLYLLFLLRPAKAWVSKFLPPFVLQKQINPEQAFQQQKYHSIRSILASLGITFVVILVSLGIALLAQQIARWNDAPQHTVDEILFPVAIISVTTISVSLSFMPVVRRLGKLDYLSNYSILVFCVSFGTLVDIYQIDIHNTKYLYLISGILISTLLLYYVGCYVFRIDTDTAIIVSTAALFTPPFIGLICEKIGNRHVFLSGLTTSIAGYAVGNYLGLALAYLLR